MEAATQVKLESLAPYRPLFPAAQVIDKTVKMGATVSDTVDFIPVIVQKTRWQVEKFVEQELQGLSTYTACEKLWNFVKFHIRYKKDKRGIEQVRSPRRLIHDGVGDCDCFTTFIDTCLSALQIETINRITKYDHKEYFQHIYPVVPLGNGKYIIMDCVADQFNYEVPYTEKKDYKMDLQFLDGIVMINQSGSTGASAHAIVTPKVPKEEVKQRVMIVLQAELDINTEVQKRGRINRTGQILKPIYDYVISAIPAEKRLMMMLQKKLKSLDANTTSNQKQSTKILDVPDFLNKYGDKVVKEYLLENKEINELLGDPLHLKDSKGEEGKSEEETENAAHRVSGRVAVLSTQMQADFYTEITERYNDYVEYLKQIGEYDLEVEALNLQTETIESSIIKMGKGGESAFGDDSILEKVHANILKKPFKKEELENLLNEALANKNPEEHKRALLDDFTNAMADRLQQEINTANGKYDELIKEVPNEKKLQRILEKQGQGAYQQAIKDRENELNAARVLAVEQLHKSFKNKQEYLQRIFNFFLIGRKLAYPVVSYDNGTETMLAVSLGVMVDKKKKNPYAPSAIRIRLAIANSNKYIAMPASFNEGISKIMAASYEIETPETDELLNEWEEEIKQKTKDRGLRFIITGNLLQAFGSESGKLVSYTTMSGDTKKGILMPEEWQPKEMGQQKITVPIIKALPLLKSMTNGSALYASNGIAFFKAGVEYRIIVPAARSKAGDIYLDKDVMALLKKNMFEKTADKMQAYMPEENIEALAVILQNKFGVSLSIGHNQLSYLKPNSERVSTRKKIVPPPNENDTELERIRLLELEAEALALEFELAA